MTTIDSAAVLSWFSGKSLENAKQALISLENSIELGYWIPGTSRSVRAALGKANLANKLAKKNGWMEDLGKDPSSMRLPPGWRVMHAMEFGNFAGLEDIDFNALRMANAKGAHGVQGVRENVLNDCERAVKAFAPVVEAMAQLDATRPAPVFVKLGDNEMSRLQKSTLEQMGALKVEVCPMEFSKVEFVDEKGQKQYKHVAKLLWPQGTIHGAQVRGGDHNCQACGHAIRNPFNWVPLILTTKGQQLKQAPWEGPQQKKALWVGRDCAKKLFGFELKGELEIGKFDLGETA